MSGMNRSLVLLLTPALLILSGCQKPVSDGPATAPPVPPVVEPSTPPTASSGPGELKSTSSGIQYQELVTGTGQRPMIGQSLQIYYTGRLKEGGEPFDSGVFNFNPMKDKVIKGWNLGIFGDAEIPPMRVGGKRKLIIPPSLGYGSMESGPIPPNSTLIFDIELKRIASGQGPFGG